MRKTGSTYLDLHLAAAFANGCYLQWNSLESAPVLWLLVAAGMLAPGFVAGLAEELTKTMSPRQRLFATALSASLAIWLLDTVTRRTDIPGVDTLIAMVPFAVALTIFVVTGVANSVNIIDGFNGLASMCVLIMLLALAYVAGQAGDVVMQTIAFAVGGAAMGFFVWNFPVTRSAGDVRSATRSPTSAHQRGSRAALGPHSSTKCTRLGVAVDVADGGLGGHGPAGPGCVTPHTWAGGAEMTANSGAGPSLSVSSRASG